MSKRSHEELLTIWDRARHDGPRPGSLWRHYAGGVYEVMGACLRESDVAPCVLYHRSDRPGPTWCRPLSEWQAMVEVDGRSVPRFVEVKP